MWIAVGVAIAIIFGVIILTIFVDSDDDTEN